VANNLPGTATGFTDSAVTVGTLYEYQVMKTAAAVGYGYVCAGIEIPPVDHRGTVVLVVDDTMATPLAVELERLRQDLIGDGWSVIRHEVSRAATVPSVKALIKADHDAAPAEVRSVLLFGHMPVPYSGDINPDGHPDHLGAWPTDLYYGELDDAWADTLVNDSGAGRAENKNVPGDGKFDTSYLSSSVDLEVGRVDLWNMPSFAKNETELLRQYLEKDHNFRHAITILPRRGLIDDNFGAFGGEAFAASGWRSFAALFGAANVSEVDWFGTLNTQGYLFAYGCGGGNYQGAGGVGGTGQFATTDTMTAFTMLFGSYFGDWDNQDAFLRAPLATATYGLTCAWAGRPHWFFHTMALGGTVGESARLSQNNSFVGIYQSQNFGSGMIHTSLMGDPTLRLHAVVPPGGLSLATDASSHPVLTWTASADASLGYHIYRAASANGPFTRLTASPVAGTVWTDSATPAGTWTYQVRAAKLETSGGGTYVNLSQARSGTVTCQAGAGGGGDGGKKKKCGLGSGFTVLWTLLLLALGARLGNRPRNQT
jgi:hypothetical protein